MASTITVSGSCIFTVAASNAIYNEVTCNLVALKMSAYNVQEQPAVFSFKKINGESQTPLIAYPTLTVYNRFGAVLAEQKPAAGTSISYTIPVAGLATSDRVMVRIYSDVERTKLLATSASISVVRENPMPFPRGEKWGVDMVFKNGEMLLLESVVYMWSSPVSGNSKVDPKTDIATHAATTCWVAYQNWPLLCTNLMMANMALIAGAVHKDGKLFSQKGTVNGVESLDYRDPKFIPNLLLDFLTGDAELAGKIEAKENSMIAGFEITGYGLRNKKDKDAYIYIESDKSGSKRLASLGNMISQVAGFDTASLFKATGEEENRGIVAIASGSNVNVDVLGGKANLAIEAIGGVKWKMEKDDHWCMPGVLKCLEYQNMDGFGRVSEWGNGCQIGVANRYSDATFYIPHDIGHTNYYIFITPRMPTTDGNYWGIIGDVVEKRPTYFKIKFKDDGGKDVFPSSFELMICGRQSINV